MPPKNTEQAIPHSIFFSCGHVIDRNTVVAPAQYNAYPDAYMSRVALKLRHEWANHDVDEDMIGSVTFIEKEKRLLLLGRLGTVRTVATGSKPFIFENIRGQFKEEHIPSESFGELLCIQAIDDVVYACGQSLQIYQRRGQQWQCANPELREMAAPALESIHGSAPNNIYAVGEKGVILHFNGVSWKPLDSPTNRPLSRVFCVSEDEVYLCGNDGAIFKGNKNQWQFIGDPDFQKNFWDMALFEGNLYLAYPGGLVICRDGSLTPVSFGLEEKPGCYHLHANDGQLWSFGIDDLLAFDGKQWRVVICPENV